MSKNTERTVSPPSPPGSAFPGGCVGYQFGAAPGASPAVQVNDAVGFVPRVRLVDYLRNTEGLALCGRGAACPG